jgi:hypothetical protein
MILNGVLVSYSKDFCQLHRTDIVNKVIAATTNIVSKAISGRMSVSLRVCVHVFTHTRARSTGACNHNQAVNIECHKDGSQ